VSLLSIIQGAAGRLGIPSPSAVISSTNAQVAQLLSLANKEGVELSARADWQVLTKEKTFLTTAAETQVGAVATDYGHYLIDSMFNRSAIRKIVGPMTPAEWQAEKAFPVYTAVNPAFRIRGNALLFTPSDVTAGQTVAYEYISLNWVLAADGTTYKAAFTVDTDTSVLNETVMTNGVVWRFKSAKGLDFTEEFQEYEESVARLIAQDGGGRPRLNLGYGLGRTAFYPANIPEGNWPS
jgi:hypothetical protein